MRLADMSDRTYLVAVGSGAMVLTRTCLLVNRGGCDLVLTRLRHARPVHPALEQLIAAGACVKVLYSDASDVQDSIEWRCWLTRPQSEDHGAAYRLSNRLPGDDFMVPPAGRFSRASWKGSKLSFRWLRPSVLGVPDLIDDEPGL